MLIADQDKSLSIYNLSTRECPERTRELFTRLAVENPVHWDRYAGTWLISRRREALTACAGAQFSERQITDTEPETGAPLAGDHGCPARRATEVISRQSLLLGEPRHSLWRPVLRTVLSSTRVAELRAWIERRISVLLAAADPAALDVVADLAHPLPFEVMAHLFGLSHADLPDVRRWSDAYTRIVTGFAPADHTYEYGQVEQFLGYALDHIRAARSRSDTDGLSTLLRLADATGRLDDLDIAANLIMLVSAAHQTTTGFIAGAVLECLRPVFGPLPGHPGDDTTVDELLARVSPSRFVGRTVLHDTELAGRQLRAGQSVLILLGAINWGERSGDAPPARPGGHVTFGLGRHHCPGARLARLEGQLVLRELFSAPHAPRLLETDVRWGTNVNLPCPEQLLICLS